MAVVEIETEDNEQPTIWHGEYVHNYEEVKDGVRYLK